MRICYIQNNKAHLIFEADEIPQLTYGIMMIDITNITPAPQEGWDYDGTTFTAPILPVYEQVEIKVPKTNLTKLQFFDSFTDDELASIYTAAKTNVNIEIMLDKFKTSEFISLIDQKTIDGINALATATLITSIRATEILLQYDTIYTSRIVPIV